MSEQEWFSPKDRLPNSGQKVTWMDSTGRPTDGVYYRRLWFLDDMSMYIYYEPTSWKPREEKETPK